MSNDYAPPPPRLSVQLEDLERRVAQSELCWDDVTVVTADRADAVACFFLACPFIVFLPIPGLTFPFGALIGLLGLRIAFPRIVGIPTTLRKKRISRRVGQKLFSMCAKVLRRIEKLIKPRYPAVTGSSFARTMLGLTISACGIIVALPLPPGTNFLPALSVVLLSLGDLERDGLCAAVGYFVVVVEILFFISVYILGMKLLT